MNLASIHVRAFAVIALMCFTHAAHADDPYSGKPGSLDLHFGEWGMGLATSRDVEGSYATAIHIDSLNRIVVGGNACIDAYCGPLLMRFDSAGRLDISGEWGEDGAVLLAESSTFDDYAAVRIAPTANDGWWVTWQDFSRNDFHVQRIDSEGRFVTGFAPGTVVEQLQAADNVGLHRIDDNGVEKLVGVVLEFGFTSNIIVMRRNIDGSPDPDFGEDGRALIPTDGDDIVPASAVLSDGRIAVLLMDYGAGRAFVHVLETDGSVSAEFGVNGVAELNAVLADALDAQSVSGEYLEATGMGLHPDGRLLIGVSACCDDDFRFRAGVLALDENGRLDPAFGNGSGLVLHPAKDDYIASVAFAVDPHTGNSTHHVWMTTDAFDSMLYFTSDGQVDDRYGDGSVRSLRFPGAGIAKWSGKLAYDGNNGLLFASDNFGSPSSVLGLDGFGVARFLAPDEMRVYDAEPDPVNDFTWPSAPVNAILGLLRWPFETRDVAITIEAMDANGRVGLPEHGDDDYSFLPRKATLPVGIVALLFHQAAAMPGTTSATRFKAGTIEFSLGSRTGVDTQPEPLAFEPIEDAPLDTFVFSNLEMIAGIDEPIDIAIENGCYFLTTFEELPDDWQQWPEFLLPENCVSTPGTAENDQVVFVAHVTASAPATTTTTTFHYGANFAQFVSTTTNAPAPVDNEPDAFDVPNVTDAEIDEDVVIGPIALTGFDTPFTVADAMNVETARIEVSTNGETWTGEVEIAPGDALWIRVRSSPAAETMLTGELYVTSLDNIRMFTITTRTEPTDDAPDAFEIPSVMDAEPDSDVVAGPIALTGFDVAFSIGDTMNEATSRIDVSTDGSSWVPSLDIAPGDSLWIRVRSASSPGTALTGELYVGSPASIKTFTVTTRAATDQNDPVDEQAGGGPIGPSLLLLVMLSAGVRRQSRRR